LKETDADDSLDEYKSTGTETSPKEIVAELMERAGIKGSAKLQVVLRSRKDKNKTLGRAVCARTCTPAATFSP
jgi:hypothetical protein